MIGIRPTNIVATVMNFGRSRFAAPSTIVLRATPSRTLLAASVATGVYRQLPRQDFHLQVSGQLFTAL
jgi:hypothetical protein